jgi:hypothetical protein
MINSLSQNSTGTFRRCALLALTLLTYTATVATAQIKITSDGKCGKPDQVQSIEVGDRTGHVLVLLKTSCTWTNSTEMAGVKPKDYVVTQTHDSAGGKGQDRGYVVMTMDNGDKSFARFTGSSATTKEGASTGEGTWSYTGGTGKLKGLTGKGTYKSTLNAEGGEDHVEGEYTVPTPPPPKTKK